jgi:hypothetical protein
LDWYIYEIEITSSQSPTPCAFPWEEQNVYVFRGYYYPSRYRLKNGTEKLNKYTETCGNSTDIASCRDATASMATAYSLLLCRNYFCRHSYIIRLYIFFSFRSFYTPKRSFGLSRLLLTLLILSFLPLLTPLGPPPHPDSIVSSSPSTSS